MSAMFVPLDSYVRDQWPEQLPQFPDSESLEEVWIEPITVEESGDGTGDLAVSSKLLFDVELEVSLPGLDAVSVVLAPGGGGTVFDLEVQLEPELEFRVVDVPIALRFDDELLQPMVKRSGSDGPTFEPDESADYVEVAIATATIGVDVEGNVGLDFDSNIDLPPCMIGDTGMIVEATDIEPYLGASPSNEPSGWRGVQIGSASIYLPGTLGETLGDITISEASIGHGGFSGTVSTTWESGKSVDLFGMDAELSSVSLTFVQNALTESKIAGTMTLPFFEEQLPITIGIDLEGGFSVGVSAPPDADEPGLVRLEREGVFSLVVESVGMEIDDGATVTLSGTIEPLVGGLDLPGVKIDELSIDEEGNVEVEGGWIDLPDQYSVNFYGLTLEITKLGFGTTDAGEKWIGLNGGIRIVEGVPAGASVEGLRIFWDEDGFDRFELDGVGVEFEVPGTLRFKGEVAFADEEFTGAIELELIALNLTIDAELVVGEHDQGFTYVGVYLDADLPAGIPLWATGTGIYGFAGLFAHQMEPGKGKEQKWYDISGDGAKSWYHEKEPGVTNLKKWHGRAGALGLGAGVTVATLPDTGYSVAGDLLLAIVFPGPIVMLQGKADVLKSGTDTSEEAAFRSIAVLDNREGSFTFGMDAQYAKGPENNPLVDIRAGVEAFFSFHDPTAWHLYIGKKKPPAERIRAKALYIFTAESYFMLDADRLALGAKVGYDADWTFGPVGVIFEAWIAGNAVVSWSPVHFFGEVLAHGKVALKAFGFSMGLSIDARIAADVYDPFHLVGEFSASMSLPWPLPDPSVDVTLEWGPQKEVPPVPRPLGEVAIGHEKSTARWPLSRDKQPIPEPDESGEYPALVTPNYADDGLLRPDDHEVARPADPEDPSTDVEEPPDPLPKVPPDARPQLTFARPVHDDGDVGVNHQTVKPEWEVVGDPAKNQGPVEVRYGLDAVRLRKWDGDDWTEIEDVYGSWAPLPKAQAGAGGATTGGGAPAMSNTKLELHSKNPFDYGRHTHGAWEEGTQRLLEDYPCTVEVECFDFDGLTIDDFTGTTIDESGTTRHELTRDGHPDWPTFAVRNGQVRPSPQIDAVETPEGTDLGLVYAGGSVASGYAHARQVEHRGKALRIVLGQPHKSVEITIGSRKDATKGAISASDGDGPVGREEFSFGALDDGGVFTFTSDDDRIESVVVEATGPIAIAEVCQADAAPERIGPRETSGIDHTREELVRWADEDEVLEPNTVYRLEVDTVVEARGQSGGALEGFHERWYDGDDPLTEYVYFRTGGPPGIDPESSLPTTVEKPGQFETGLADLSRYVRGTVPETVPAEGEQPVEPRPVYRAYDVGVEFSENYVETLYRMARRDLGLYLFDANDRPVRDVEGRLVATDNQWSKTDSLLLSEHDRAWLRRVRASGCMDVDENTIPLDDALSADEGATLDPATSYEARLSPVLVHEAFDDGRSHWRQVGDGGPDWTTPGHDGLSGEDARPSGSAVTLDGDPSLGDIAADADSIHFPGDRNRESGDYRITAIDAGADEVTLDGEPDLASDDRRWRIAPRHVLRQTALVPGSATDAPESTFELSEHPRLENAMQSPEEWTDYRVQATVRADRVHSGAIGLAFRRDGSGDGYRFELDADENAWKLVRIEGGDETVLARYEQYFEIPRGTVEVPLEGGIGGELGAIGGVSIPSPWTALDEGRDYRLTVEAIGSDLRVYVDGEPAITVEDDAHSAGTVGVYCRAVAEAHVPEVRVDDYRAGEPPAPVAYRFKFTTSQYANFFHQAHSFQDETWQGATDVSGSGPHPAAQLAAAVSEVDLGYAEAGSLSPPAQSEVRSFDAALATLTGDGSLDQLLRQRPDRVTVTRFDGDAGPMAYLLQSPEPLDWSRTDLTASYADADAPAPAVPDGAKLTDATLGSDESVTLLFREATDPTDFAVDYRRSSEPGFDATLADERFAADFAGSFGSRYQVIDRPFGPIGIGPDRPIEPIDSVPMDASTDGDGANDTADSNAGDADGTLDLERQFLVDLASSLGALPSVPDLTGDPRGSVGTWGGDGGWRVEDDALVGGGIGVEDVVARGVTAADGVWTTTVSAANPGKMGLLFRYAGENDHYRFSIAGDGGLRLVRRHGGTTDVLWQGGPSAAPVREYRLGVVATDGQLRGYLDGVPAFVVADPGGSGSVGVHAGRAGEVTVTELSVHGESYESRLFAEDFSGDLDAWAFEDVPPYTTQKSDWHVADGQLRQTSNIYGHVGNEYHEPGTHGVAGDPDWRDYRATVRLGSGDDDALGLLVRYQDPDNYYRFSMDHEREYRRLVKRIDGTTHLLWEDDVGYDSGREYVLTVECVGATITGYLDGERLFSVEDADLAAGQIGLYSRANDVTYFDGVRVTAPADGWVPYYEFVGETTLPAGTRVRINRAGPVPDEAGLIQRDLAPDGDPPAPLPSSGVHLRVRSPGVPVHAATAGHTRRFLPDGDFEALPMKVLRNADGTGLLLVPAESVDAGQLRLSLTYHREAGERTLRQAGYSDPEHAVLDVPWETRSTDGE